MVMEVPKGERNEGGQGEEKKMGVKDTFIYEKCKNALDATFPKKELLEECKMFYKNKFRCRMFVPIDDNFDKWWKKNDETEKNSKRS